jgi:hypothetical protein
MNGFWFPLRNPDLTFNILRFQREFEVELHENVLFTRIRKKKTLDRVLTRTNTCINRLSEAVRKVMAAVLTILAQKIAALRYLVSESRSTCRSWSYRRQFGNFSTDLYTLRDPVSTFTRALRTFFPTYRRIVIKAKGSFRQTLLRAIQQMYMLFPFCNNC